MQSANVIITVNGTPFPEWEEVTVTASVKEAARAFVLRIAPRQGGKAAAAIFANFAAVQIFESGEMVFNGYVDKRKPKLTKKERLIVIAGRAKGQDAVDCSCIHKTGRFDNQTLLQIAQALDQFGIGYSSDAQLDPIPEYQLKPGASLFREIERLCRDQNLTQSGQANGGIKLTQAGKTAKRQAGVLIEGVNLEEIEGDFDVSNRHSNHKVRGQSYDGNGADHLQIEGSANDDTVPRMRPLVIVQDANTDKTRAKNRAVYHRDKSVGESIRAEGETPGWRDEAGMLWTPGNIVWCSSPYLDLEQDMLIESLTYKAHAKGGSSTHFALVDPRAHGGQASQAGQSGSMWNFDSSQGSDA